jgi:magnesium-transporting ATPase (P-type)
MLQLLLLFAFLIPAILFFSTQQKTLNVIQPENRLMSPGMVWLQLIPLIGLVWQFFVVTKIANSISKELESPKDDSILGISITALDALDKRPTFIIGITYCTLSTASIIWNMVTMQTLLWINIITLLLVLGGMICWIIYWVILNRYKNRIQSKASPLVIN